MRRSSHEIPNPRALYQCAINALELGHESLAVTQDYLAHVREPGEAKKLWPMLTRSLELILTAPEEEFVGETRGRCQCIHNKRLETNCRQLDRILEKLGTSGMGN